MINKKKIKNFFKLSRSEKLFKLKKYIYTFKKELNSLIFLPFLSFFKFFFRTDIGKKIFFLSLTKDTLISFKTKNAKLIVNTSDNIIGYNSFINNNLYGKEDLLNVFEILDKKKELIVDVGANIGTISINAIKNNFVKKSIAFEPEINNFNLLRKNIILNQLEKEIIFERLAVSNIDHADMLIDINSTNHGDHRVRNAKKENTQNINSIEISKCKSITLNSYLKDINLDSAIFWIDVQGYEGFVLKGSDNVINNRIPLCIEYSPEHLIKTGSYDLFFNEINKIHYKNLIDLNNPNKVFDLSKYDFNRIIEEYFRNMSKTNYLFF